MLAASHVFVVLKVVDAYIYINVQAYVCIGEKNLSKNLQEIQRRED